MPAAATLNFQEQQEDETMNIVTTPKEAIYRRTDDEMERHLQTATH
jgi:hypothetical protein